MRSEPPIRSQPSAIQAAWLCLAGSLLVTGCLPGRELQRRQATVVDEPVVALSLEEVPRLAGPFVDASTSGDGTLWALDRESRVVVVAPGSETPKRLSLADPSGHALLDPVAIDATAGLSVLVADGSTGQVVRYDRNGALLGAWTLPSPGPGILEVDLEGTPVGPRATPDRMVSVSGDRVAVVDDQSNTLFVVDERLGTSRVVPLPLRVSAIASRAGMVVLAAEDGRSLLVVSAEGLLQYAVAMPYEAGLGPIVDLAFQDQTLYLLTDQGGLWLMEGVISSDTLSPPRLKRFRPANVDVSRWTHLMVQQDALWWIGEDRVFRSARPR
jgi:hypothetical protein